MNNNFHINNNRVTVRVWTSKFNNGANVGHVSMETPNNYISLWPQGEPSGKLKQFYENRPATFIANYQDDLKLEQREPEFTICLYSLNTASIDTTFIVLRKLINQWTLSGNNKILNQHKAHSCASIVYLLLRVGGIVDLLTTRSSFLYFFTSESIAQPVNSYNLLDLLDQDTRKALKALSDLGAVISQLVLNDEVAAYTFLLEKSFKDPYDLTIISPDDVQKIVLCAKQHELRKYPQTANFTFNGETEVLQENNKTTSCIIS